MTAFEIWRYRTASNRIPFTEWLIELNDPSARERIAKRIDRLSLGSFGDWKSLGRGVFELRIDYGPGYRVYYGQIGKTLVLLLCGGSKQGQDEDIRRAHEYWKDYKARIPDQPMESGRSPEE